jgi:hypothetical protein
MACEAELQTIMTLQFSRRFLVVQVLLLLVGTQMPGAWRAGVVDSLHAPGSVSSWAHFVLFAGMAAVALSRPMAWSWARVLLGELGLALLSEGLQFFAINRHLRWLDVGIDMGGALAGMALALLVPRLQPAGVAKD